MNDSHPVSSALTWLLCSVKCRVIKTTWLNVLVILQGGYLKSVQKHTSFRYLSHTSPRLYCAGSFFYLATVTCRFPALIRRTCGGRLSGLP